MKIIIKEKYFLFKYNNSIKKVISGNTIKEINTNHNISKDDIIILITLKKEPNFTYNATDKLNIIGGPIKITFKLLVLSNTNKLKPKYEEQLNKKGEKDLDRRNAQYLYVSNKYYTDNKKVKKNHLKIIAELAIKNKLERRPFAPKLLDNYI
jgi:hypothetical protein